MFWGVILVYACLEVDTTSLDFGDSYMILVVRHRASHDNPCPCPWIKASFSISVAHVGDMLLP